MRGNLIGVPKRNNTAPVCDISAFYAAGGIKSDGQIWMWGTNTNFALGIASNVNCAPKPTLLSGATRTYCYLAVGSYPGYAITNTGRVWAWGSNASGQLGDNSIVAKSTPVSVCGAVKTFCRIAAGGSGHVISLDKYGRVWTWGYNISGQLGRNSTVSFCTPVSILGAVKTFCKIGAGFNTTGAIDKNGQIWMWGSGNFGALGRNNILSVCTPVSVCGATKTFCKLFPSGNSSGFTHAIDKYGQVWGWGLNSSGYLGNNSTASTNTPVSISGAKKTFCELSSFNAAGAIDKYGQLWTWGPNLNGTLGINEYNSVTCLLTPVSICGAKKTFCKVAMGSNFGVALDNYQNVWAWGYSQGGSIGNNAFAFFTPVSISGAKKTFCKIDTAVNTVLAIRNTGVVWGWVNNNSGALGIGTVNCTCTPVSISGALKTFCQIRAGSGYSAGIDKNGKIWMWGGNSAGQLGNNSVTNYCTPISVCGATKTFCRITFDQNPSGNVIAIDNYGQAWSWGIATFGGLGNNTSTGNLSTPKKISGATKTFCQVDCSNNSVSAIDKNGRMWAWGYNSSGQLGNNNLVSFSTPISVAGAAKTFCSVIAKTFSRLALDKYGRIWGWGSGTSGQFGNNAILNFSTPTRISGAAKTFCEIAFSGSTGAGIDKYGRLWTWGANSVGMLGNNSTTNYSTPISVCGAVRTFCKIAMSSGVMHGIDNRGQVWGWGQAYAIGLNLPLNYLTPVRVCSF